jgi:NAD(P)-dependent dehydrogenase (short-subunit alcohol dehydrogenase family)
MAGELNNKIALVTGASRGIGAAIAQRFAAEGAMVIIASRTLSGMGNDHGGQAMPGSVEEVVATIEATGGNAIGWRCDVGDPAARAAMAEAILSRFGAIDILVNNATTTGGSGRYDTLTTAQYDQVFQVNAQGCLDLIQRFTPGMVAKGRGWVLNLTSKAAELLDGPPFSPVYSGGGLTLYGAAKAALNRITSGVAAELHGTGVAVNALAPVSVVWTPGVAASGVSQYRSLPEWVEEPVEGMAEAALALCTADPDTVTGKRVYSTEFLASLGRRIRSLDGRSVIENWKPTID